MTPTDTSRPRLRGSAALAATIILLVAPAGAQPPVDRVGWLGGCWRMSAGPVVIEEQWTAPRGGAMLGVGRTVRRDSVVEYEFLRVYAAGDTLVYDARPSGQPRAEFHAAPGAASGDVTEIVFSNPTHDFPQRVAYRRVSADSVVARIEGTRGGQTRTISFPYRRVACPGG
jgi:hypothetical protein